MPLEVVPLSPAVGAEIRGLDLSASLDDATFAEVEATFDRHGVLLLRDQHIEPSDQLAFGARFGAVEHNYNAEAWGVPGHPELFVLSNITEDGRSIGARGVGGLWHSDMCYASCPPRATLLHAIEVPVLDGLPLGDTEFASAAAAWDALPEAMRVRVDGLQARFDFRGRKRAKPVSEEVANRYPPVLHPLVRRHPNTGRKSLYVMRDDCTGIDGLDDDRAAALIHALADHIVRPEFVYRHRWRADDVLMWDNCTVQHRALFDYGLPQRRRMHRLTIAGGPPLPGAA